MSNYGLRPIFPFGLCRLTTLMTMRTYSMCGMMATLTLITLIMTTSGSVRIFAKKHFVNLITNNRYGEELTTTNCETDIVL